GFLQGDPRLQTPQNIKRFGEIFLTAVPTRRDGPQHRKRGPCIGSFPDFCAEKLRRRHADDAEDSLSQYQLVVEAVGIGAEAMLPETVGNDHDGMIAFRGIVAFVNHPADLWTDS